jgi:hypothetical protein
MNRGKGRVCRVHAAIDALGMLCYIVVGLFNGRLMIS